jgi:hypothetical protein
MMAAEGRRPCRVAAPAGRSNLEVAVASGSGQEEQKGGAQLMRKLSKKYGFVPDRLVTDDLRSYAAAARDR